MYAMLDLNGNQIKVVPGEKVIVDNLNREDGETFENTNVMLLSDGEDVRVGKPYLENVTVKFEVVRSFKGEKRIVFKKRRRKSSKVKRGSRPYLTKLQVVEIVK